MAIRAFLTNFQLGMASGWDIFIGLILLLAVLAYGLFLGRNRMVVLLLSSYFSLLIVRVLPWERLAQLKWLGIGQEPSSSLKILVFSGIILIFYFLIPRSILSSTLRIKKRGGAAWWQLFLLSIVQVGFLAMAMLSFLSPENINELDGLVKKIFIGSGASFIWTTFPILVLVLMRRKKKSDD